MHTFNIWDERESRIIKEDKAQDMGLLLSPTGRVVQILCGVITYVGDRYKVLMKVGCG